MFLFALFYNCHFAMENNKSFSSDSYYSCSSSETELKKFQSDKIKLQQTLKQYVSKNIELKKESDILKAHLQEKEFLYKEMMICYEDLEEKNKELTKNNHILNDEFITLMQEKLTLETQIEYNNEKERLNTLQKKMESNVLDTQIKNQIHQIEEQNKNFKKSREEKLVLEEEIEKQKEQIEYLNNQLLLQKEVKNQSPQSQEEFIDNILQANTIVQNENENLKKLKESAFEKEQILKMKIIKNKKKTEQMNKVILQDIKNKELLEREIASRNNEI